MKEWDQNDFGKGARINLPVIQQSVKGKAFPEAAPSPPTVTSHPSCSRKAPGKDEQVMCASTAHSPRRRGGRAAGRAHLHSRGLIYLPSSSNFNQSSSTPQVNGCPPILRPMAPSSKGPSNWNHQPWLWEK